MRAPLLILVLLFASMSSSASAQDRTASSATARIITPVQLSTTLTKGETRLQDGVHRMAFRMDASRPAVVGADMRLVNETGDVRARASEMQCSVRPSRGQQQDCLIVMPESIGSLEVGTRYRLLVPVTSDLE